MKLKNRKWLSFPAAFAVVAAMTGLGLLLPSLLTPPNILMLYLLAVVIIALRFGRGPSVFTSVLSVLTFEYFTLPPKFAFRIHTTEDLVTLSGLLITGLTISNLTGRFRQGAINIEKREEQTKVLYQLSQGFGSAFGFDGVLAVLEKHVRSAGGKKVYLFLPENGRLSIRGKRPEADLVPNDWAAAGHAYETGFPSGAGTESYGGSPLHFRLLKAGDKRIGVLAVEFQEKKSFRDETRENSFFDTVAAQAAIAFERARLAEEAQKMALLREKEKLQSVLLNSISHDLRTPLFSINGMLKSVLTRPLDDATRKELIETAFEESERLNRVVGNLLDITRIEAGAFELSRKPVDLRDLVGSALAQFPAAKLSGRQIGIEIAEELPEIHADFTLMIRVLANLIDNALKYSPASSPVRIRGKRKADAILIEVADEGFGVPEHDLSLVFEKFFRSEHLKKTAGIGLGLSICKGIVEAHCGRIWAERRPRGSAFIIEIPARPQ